ncbi:Odorant response abnormal protein 4 [Caenorhabditis elegans]|uniref:Odorant response abnormal protein 4 n=1 Tax=Caenorhabditis elegans TaxID=6239 RepID=ODR4_CAEEL|nr:Odorant response abnormal protein 4 [Caenorhabditis elegans]Q8I7F8.1 RecName: Full=Odorant response abnormal protein 4 [Caenorhabditis elegans]CCD70712.1 Odorant response abnormal protein 4 [Caenorhabditis elegans]|eukprot:NP_001022814.1 Odorant response abnormal protein 4 [Caenorhabditis elegans]
MTRNRRKSKTTATSHPELHLEKVDPMKTVTESMILFDVQLQEWVTKSAKNHEFVLSDKGIPASAYFLLGSFCSDGDIHVAYASKCPVHSSALEENATESSKMLEDEWMSDHAERLLRMLPGGIHVVGIAWFSDKKTFSDRKSHIHKTLGRIQKMNNQITTANVDDSISDNMITVFFETPSTTPIGAIIDVTNRGNDSAQKVQFQKLEWISLVTNASARIVHNVPVDTGRPTDFYSDLVVATKNFVNNLFQCEFTLLDGEIRDDKEPLIKDIKKNKKTTIEAQLFLNPLYNRELGAIDDIASNMHEVLFDIEVRAAVPIRSTVKDAIRAIKHHLVRNLFARVELHYESMEVVEEERSPKTGITVHQLPRPATTVLYTHPAILINDFLFEADNVEDAQKNFDDMMDLQTSIEHVDEGWERALTPEEMEAVRTPIEDLHFVDFDGSSDSWCTTKTILITIALIIGLLASIIYFTVAHS